MASRINKVIGHMVQVDNTQTRLDTQGLKNKYRKNIDIDELGDVIEHHHHEMRKRMYDVVNQNPIFIPKYQMSLHEERELALKRLQAFCGTGLFSVKAFMPGNDPREIFAAHELAGFIDGSMATKLTVQFNLFGSTLVKMGTERHYHLLDGIDRLDEIGCFGLTELGYGNNAIKMETTATYDPSDDTWIVHTPTPLAQKYWITNSAVHAKWIIVFAQTYVHGKHEGLHTFLVRMRDDNMMIQPGVRIEDMGVKMGCNGVDNGKIWFNKVKIPRSHLLNRFADLDSSDQFVCGIKKLRARFIKVADGLLSGRICIASMSNTGAMCSLATLMRYAATRLTVGPTGESDTPIMDYQLVQNAVLPLLAESICLRFGMNYVKDRYAGLDGADDPHETMVLCTVIKPMVTWQANEVGNICRERAGGQGYLSVNRLGEAISFAHAGMTAEGDNSVLFQKVAKELGARLKKGKHKFPRKLSETSNMNRAFNLLLKREKDTLLGLGATMQKKMSAGKPLFQVWMKEEADLVQKVSWSYGQRMVLEQAMKVLDKFRDVELKTVMTHLVELYAVHCVCKDTWFLMTGTLSPADAQKMQARKDELVKLVAPYALSITDSFRIPEAMFGPVGKNWEKYNVYHNFGERMTNYPLEG